MYIPDGNARFDFRILMIQGSGSVLTFFCKSMIRINPDSFFSDYNRIAFLLKYKICVYPHPHEGVDPDMNFNINA